MDKQFIKATNCKSCGREVKLFLESFWQYDFVRGPNGNKVFSFYFRCPDCNSIIEVPENELGISYAKMVKKAEEYEEMASTHNPVSDSLLWIVSAIFLPSLIALLIIYFLH